jgi:hypothetical protein
MHVQTTASALWTINHNFGYRPSVTLLTSGGAEMDASIIHASDNQVLVTFTTPQTGSARCL